MDLLFILALQSVHLSLIDVSDVFWYLKCKTWPQTVVALILQRKRCRCSGLFLWKAPTTVTYSAFGGRGEGAFSCNHCIIETKEGRPQDRQLLESPKTVSQREEKRKMRGTKVVKMKPLVTRGQRRKLTNGETLTLGPRKPRLSTHHIQLLLTPFLRREEFWLQYPRFQSQGHTHWLGLKCPWEQKGGRWKS